ncbi:energy-coupling factor transporter transmembrane component T family protein [Paraoerskovia marina]|uniref:energy-coupling factor transporter transmembrane component T family protein n=1 Tax=Paraoerskovia marina TaxID=545619 RepID=UPI0006948183|nr:energy-coupling factor transporter transmembrane component T [Paraoerskovia marina]
MTARTSAFGRWNPTVKLGTLLAASAVIVAVTDPWTPTILWAAAVCAAVVAGRVPPRTLAGAHAALLAFALSIFVGNVLLRSAGEVVAVVGPVRVTDHGLDVAAALAIRVFYLGVISVILVATTDPVRLMTSLHQHARLPAGATFAVLAGMRVLEQLPAEWTTIRCAQALRDPGHEPGRLPTGVRATGAATFTLLVGAVRRAERISVALEARGLGSGPRTLAHPVPLGPGDVALAAAVGGTVTTVLVIGAAAGWLTGPGALTAG